MKLFLDDIRVPSDVGLINEEWTIVRDYFVFKAMIQCFYPQEISFDHDLHCYDKEGRELTGMNCAYVLIEEDESWNAVSKDFKFHVHSMNPVGKKNIEGLLNGYIKHKFGEKR